MTTVGFNFTKIVAERKNISDQNIRIENNVGIVNISEANVLDPKKSLIRFEFNFACKYEPGLGMIDLSGELIEMYEKELALKIIEMWNKEKKVYGEIMAKVLNNVLSRANIEAIVISKELGLPSPVAMPKVEVSKPVDKVEAKPVEKTEEKNDSKKKK